MAVTRRQRSFLARAAIAGVAFGIGWSVMLAVSGRAGGPRFERLQAAVVSLIIAGTTSGVLLLVSGARPAGGLHLRYAVIAIALSPRARSPRPATGSADRDADRGARPQEPAPDPE